MENSLLIVAISSCACTLILAIICHLYFNYLIRELGEIKKKLGIGDKEQG